MYLKEYLSIYSGKKIKLFVDMDGVIADYDFGKAYDYDKKRPLYDNIKKLEEISKDKNIELYILSSSRINDGVEQKNDWLDNYAPFFKKENRIIISREENDFKKSAQLKSEYIKNIKRDDFLILVIDDDPSILKMINEVNKDVILLKDTVLID